MSDELITKIDDGLAKYYEKLKRDDYFDNDVGKFAFFVEESGFDNDGIEDELKQKPDESTILEFDEDFPFESPIEDEDAQNIEIHRILNDIAKYGAPREALETMELRISICNEVADDKLSESTAKYTSQMKSLESIQQKDGDLRWFLAVGTQQNFPFLAYMVDSFTKENAENHFESVAKKNKGDLSHHQALSVAVWLEKKAFFRALHKKYPLKAEQLVSAMRNYTNRIMGRLKFNPIYKINDNLSNIIEYIVSIPRFINRLIDDKKSTARPPFQVDLLIAVGGVIAQLHGNQNDNDDNVDNEEDDDDDDDDDDDANDDETKDHIGYVQDEFKKMEPRIYYAPPNDRFEVIAHADNEEKEIGEGIERVLGERYTEFRTVLSGNPPNDANSQHYIHQKSKYFDAKTYPWQRRFSVFIDRRMKKPTKTDSDKDEMTIFEPPDDCNKMADNHVPEIGFEFLRKCILPRATAKEHITAKDAVCGQLLTFMFNVEAKDEIKCYIVWCGQTMRFHGDHISKILPFIFIDNEENRQFLKSKETKRLQDIFEKYNDRKFAKFYMALKNFGK